MRFHNCAWVCRANAFGANPGGPVWDRPLRRRETVFVIRRRGGSQTRPLKPSPFQGEGGWPLGQTDEGDFLARTPPAGAPRGSPTQIKDRFWKPVREGLAPPAGRSGTGPYERSKPFLKYIVGAAISRPFWRFPPPGARRVVAQASLSCPLRGNSPSRALRDLQFRQFAEKRGGGKPPPYMMQMPGVTHPSRRGRR